MKDSLIRLASYVCFLLLIFTCCVYHDLAPKIPAVPLVSCDTVSWQQHILPIMEQSCSTKGCHDGRARLDWRKYEIIRDYAQSVKEQTLDHSMPPDFRITEKEIQSISCWVDSGAIKN